MDEIRFVVIIKLAPFFSLYHLIQTRDVALYILPEFALLHQIL